MHKNLSLLAVLLVVSAGTADAQSFLSAEARAELATQSAGPRRPGTLVFSVMGALIGAGTGFFVSQVVHDDWEKETNSTFASHRRSFAISGAAVGTVAALLLDRADRPSGRTGTVLATRNAAAQRAGAGGAIMLEELQEATGRNAYDAVQALRPQWLIERGETLGSIGTLMGATSGAGAGNVTAVEGEARIGAFLDGVRLQDVSALKNIPIATIERIEFRTGSVGASGGPGHVQRAILVFSADGRTE